MKLTVSEQDFMTLLQSALEGLANEMLGFECILIVRKGETRPHMMQDDLTHCKAYCMSLMIVQEAG